MQDGAYALVMHQYHAQPWSGTQECSSREALALCSYQGGLRKLSPEFGEGAAIDMGLLPAYSCKLSEQPSATRVEQLCRQLQMCSPLRPNASRFAMGKELRAEVCILREGRPKVLLRGVVATCCALQSRNRREHVVVYSRATLMVLQHQCVEYL